MNLWNEKLAYSLAAQQDFDILLVVGAKKFGMSEVVKVARQFNLPEEKLLGDWIVCIPGFTLDKYRRLQRSRLSIISRQCFGGCVSNMLGLPFRSPLVNLFVLYEDFLKFLRAPKVYLESEPHFERLTSTSQEAPDGYPLLSLADISLNMMHYKTPEDALAKWNERKHRVTQRRRISGAVRRVALRQENLLRAVQIQFGFGVVHSAGKNRGR